MITNIFNIFNLKLDIEIPETVISFYTFQITNITKLNFLLHLLKNPFKFCMYF